MGFKRAKCQFLNPFWYIMLVGLFIFGYSLEANPEDKGQITSAHTEFTDANDAKKAIASYQELLNTDISPEEKRLIQLKLAKEYVLTKQFPLALSEYDKLLAVNSKDCQVRQTLVDLILSFAQFDAKNNNHQLALNWYVAAIALDPSKRALLLREYTDELSKSGNGPGAVILYKEILSGSTLSLEDRRLANLGLAQTYIWLNKHEEALNIYDALLKNDPGDKEARKGKAKVYLDYARFDASKGNHVLAIDWFRKAIEANPDERLAILKELADQLTYNSKFDESIVLYHEILDSHPGGNEEREAVLSLAKVYTEKFLYDDALKEYDKLLMQNKYDARAKQGKARVYIDFATYNSHLGKHREAILWYYKAIENDPIIRPELLIKIETERAILGDKDNPAKSKSEIDIEACLINESPEIEGVLAEPKPVPATFEKTDESQKSIPETKSQFEKQASLSTKARPSAKELSKESFEQALEYAKYLEVFQANLAFESSLVLDPENRNYREQYAWHLQAFFFRPEALFQLEILLPDESDKTPYYEALAWNYRFLGLLKESIWAFSNLYDIPCYLTLNNKYIIANKFYRSTFYTKIFALWGSLACADERGVLEIKKKLFDYYTYLGELEMASSLALEILMNNPEEYLVHYHYAALLHQKRKYPEAVIQFELLLEKLPCNSFLYLSLGKVLEDMDCICKAETAYQYALSIDQNPETKRAYARILSKIGDCDRAVELSNEIASEMRNELIKELSNAEVSLNCGDYENSAYIYRNILDQYPYNQEALFGSLKSSTYTGNNEDARQSYRRWPDIWFDKPLQNHLARYFRPPEFVIPIDYYHDSNTFWRTSTGLNYNMYAFDNIRFFANSFFTQFGEHHFDTINRQSLSLGFDKLLNKSWEFHCSLIENYYKNLQHNSKNASNHDLYSKAVINYHLHLTYLKLPEFTADIGYDYYDIIDTIPPFENPIYNYSNQIGGAALNIRTRDVKLFLYYNKEKLYWLASVVYGKYTDGNTKKTVSFRTGYRFCDVPENYVYYSYFYLSFAHKAPIFYQNGYSENAYYDPKNLEIHSIGVTSKYDFTPQLQIGGELALLYLPKVSNFGNSCFGYMNYQFTDQLSCRLDLRYFYQNQGVGRTGRTGYFHAENASFGINYIF